MALNHDVTGSVNYNVVGSPTIVDGVVSGFSASNYLTISNYSALNNSNIEINLCFTLLQKTQYSAAYNVYGFIIGSAVVYSGIQVIYEDNPNTVQNIRIRFADGTQSVWCDTQIPVIYGKQYILNIKFNNGNAEIHCSVDGNNYNISYTPSNTVVFISNLLLGVRGDKEEINGSIDLNNTYIKVNGQAWFGNCPVEVKHIDYGTSVGYTKVGSPTISNGVLSDSSQANCITVNIPNSTTINTLEFNVKIKAEKGITYLYHGWDNFFIFYSEYYGQVSTQSPGSNFQRYLTVADGTNCNLNAVYDASTLTWTATLTNLDTQETATQTWQYNSAQDYSGTWYLGNHSWNNNNTTVGGEVDLNQTYIKINGKLWFYKPCTNYLVKDDKLVFADSGLYLAGPNTYTKVGSPTVVDGVASGFSSSDYLDIGSPDLNNDWEIACAFTYKQSDTSQFPISASNWYSQGPIINSAGFCSAWVVGSVDGTALSGLSNRSSYVLEDGKKYIVSTAKQGRVFSLIVKDSTGQLLDTQSLTIPEGTYSVSSPLYRIGWFYSASSAFNSSIDLNNTYIKVNGSLWFYGKNYASQNIAPVPSGYTYGNTTTSAIGWVDMRTQQFTAAPSGATIGRDE